MKISNIDTGKRLRSWELALLVTLSVGLCCAAWAGGVSRDISSRVLRLHVVAASDEAVEQELKLRVRDAVLARAEPMVTDAADRAEAEARLRRALPELREAAMNEAGGREITVTLGTESFPTRYYDGFALPAGSYMALRVTIGEGAGQNWWCVIFPSLCGTALPGDALETAGFPDSEVGLIADTDDYQIRFRLLELIGRLAG